MDKLAAAALALALLALAIFAAPLVGITVGITVGAFAGWVVGQFFPGTVGLVGSAISGGAALPAWQVGAILGFVGGFFKARVTVRKD